MSRSMATMVSPLPVTAHDEPSRGTEEGSFPRLGVNEATDQMRVMLSLEKSTYGPSKPYLIRHSISEGSDQVTEGWRRRICEWIFEVVDHFSFDREVVSVALSYLDRSASLAAETSEAPITKREFQLFAVTSLYLAIKIHGETDGAGGRRLKLRISAFEELSRGYFKVKTIEAMERRIVRLLNWRLNPPTPAQYIARFVRLIPEWSPCYGEFELQHVASRLYDVAKYLTELACFSSTSSFDASASIVAYAALLCAIEFMKKTLQLPEHVEADFLRNIENVSESMSPMDDCVVKVQQAIRGLAPAMFDPPPAKLTRVVSLLDGEDRRENIRASRESPTCVWEETEQAQRKRARTGAQ